ncbi:MAG TPA: acyl-CoA dehydrogenase family protein [Actinophytocola sp.]|uniref:acyl-CoA dehydrogenase family protein n=1 Tax=Actinophytocola sp. TaxID=1872138 RepID=UPI002DDD12B9|nr:acyl-CoA dehydrogenase family protein [Actinophytocola sp.]HEV2779521.1 acyl-CoA dehydrogenase family protein [Actinophytocola sp.]
MSTAILDDVRAFVDTEVAPNAEEFDRAERLPRALLDRVGELGLWAPFLPAEVGGAGLDMVTLGRIHEEIGRGCSGLRSMLTVHTMVSWAVGRWGSDAQRDRWLPQLIKGETFGVFALSEPDSGSDASAAGTLAVPDGDGWVLDGRKKWITGGQVADVLLVFARSGQGMSAFLVPRDAAGVEISPIPNMLGTRSSMIAEVVLRDVRIGADAVLGPPGWAAGTVMTGALDLGRYSVACGSVGIIQACLDACVAYTSRRTVRDGQLRDLQLIRRKVSDMVTSARAARLLCEHAGRLKDAGDPATIMASWVAKYYASTAAATAASDAVQIHGANGCSPDYPVARLYRDAKIMEIIEGSSELQQTTIAEEAYREAA